MHKKPINVECRLYALSDEARDWLHNHTSDLVWSQNNWRIWDEPATYDELDREEQIKYRIYPKKGMVYTPPLKRRWIDVVRFASKRDAMYFKLMFL